MRTYQHPAHQLAFADLLAGLEAEVAARNVNAQDNASGLRIYNYSDRCVYEQAWNEFSLMARGLILEPATRRIVATPFPKFFNYGEGGRLTLPDEPFEVFEKLDGSLIILYHHAGAWHAATRGNFASEQAKWAQARLDANPAREQLDPACTYLAEAVYPENRVVIAYAEAALVFLAAFDGHGFELPFADVAATAGRLGWRAARVYAMPDVAALLETARRLPGTEEGFVLRFASGLRLKFKGDEYRRLHKCIAGVTPLALWEAMRDGQSLAAMRRDVPEEFWADFDAIAGALTHRLETLLRRIEEEYAKVADLTDKELGLRLPTLPEETRGWMFVRRKAKGRLLADPQARRKVMEAIRPTGNRLEGYRPSSAMSRVQEAA